MSKDLCDIMANIPSAVTISLQKLQKEANFSNCVLFPQGLGRLGFWGAYNSVEAGGFADIGESDDAGLEAHAQPRA